MPLNDAFGLILATFRAVWNLVYQYSVNHPWAVAAAVYGLARSFGVTIQSGQRAVLFRWGRAKNEMEPGFHWLVPIVDAVKKMPGRSVTIVLPEQQAMTADGLVYDVNVNFVYRVTDATRALTLVDHIDKGCRDSMPIIVTEMIRVRDQAQLVDRASLDHELFERMNAWVARWGLVVEQAGFTSIAPGKAVLHTTQLRSRTMERAKMLRMLLEAGLDAESALVMIGTERRPVAKSSRRYHVATRKGRASARDPLRP